MPVRKPIELSEGTPRSGITVAEAMKSGLPAATLSRSSATLQVSILTSTPRAFR